MITPSPRALRGAGNAPGHPTSPTPDTLSTSGGDARATMKPPKTTNQQMPSPAPAQKDPSLQFPRLAHVRNCARCTQAVPWERESNTDTQC